MRRSGAVAAVPALLFGLVQVAAASPAAALTLPAGFTVVDYETGQAAYTITNFAWLDDGGLLSIGKDGTITVTPGGGSPRLLTTVPSVRAIDDHGLLGLALANDYRTTGHLYLAYDKGDRTGSGVGVVEEWTATPAGSPVSLARTATVLDGSALSPPLAQVGNTHAIDAVEVAPDGTLFVSIGDDSGNNGDPSTLRAQDLDQPYGKLLHLTADGRGVPTNPYYSASTPTSWRSLVYAYGLRNPFRFNLDPRSGIPHVGDVGWNTTEEVDTLAPGANAGWPCYEGMERTTFASSPVCQALYAAGSAEMPQWAYPHTMGNAVVGGIHYSGTSYPTQYRDSYFFGDYGGQRIWTLATDLQGHLTRQPEPSAFATAVGAPVAFHTGPNGDVTYADLVTGTVRRLVYTSGNRAPVARFSSTTDAQTRTVTFAAGDSYDLDGDQLTYSWDLADGSTGAGVTVSHTYSSGSAVEVTLTVRDQLGAVGVATATVHPSNHTPDLALETPPARTYAVGEPVSLTASASDVEDGNLSVSWDTAILHCPAAGSCHLHPDGTVAGASYRQPFTDHGSDTTMLITAHAVDSLGATTSVTYEARPTLRMVAVDSPVAVSINGATATSAQVVAGSTVELEAPVTALSWQFTGWSDGGAASHAFTMPDGDLTLAARYVTAIDLRYAALGGASSILGAPTTTEYTIAGGRARNYAAGRIYWSVPTGAHFLSGELLSRYLAAGGPAGYGLPVTDVTAVTGGWEADFTGNRSIYSSPTTGAHLVMGAIRTTFLRGGGPATFGFPTTDEVVVTGGRASTFTRARIYWSPSTGAHFVSGVLLRKYLAAGGPAGYGLPMTDPTRLTGGWRASFGGGRRIYYSAATDAHLVYGSVLKTYASLGYQSSCLGYPTTDEYAIDGGRRNRFVGGTITYLYRTGAATARC